MNKKIKITLKKIADKLKDSHISWAITGSVGHLISGIKIEPKDIDIITDIDGAYKIEKIFGDFIIKNVQYSVQDNMKSYFGIIKINDIIIEIMGNIQNNVNGKWVPHTNWKKNVKYATIDNIEIPVLSLNYEYKIYKMLNKVNRVQLIENKLKKSE